MRGIISYGAYVPYNRLQRSKITEALGAGGGRGARAVASFDEDTTTMAVAAGRVALADTDTIPTSVYFATSAPAYLDKNNATAIHAALDLPTSTSAFDMGGSSRSGSGALRAALHGGGGATLVALADLRTGLAGGGDEASLGDGAAVMLIGDDADGTVIAEFVGDGSASQEFLDRWRTPGDNFSKVWEERFSEAAYAPLIEDAVTTAYESAGLKPEDVKHVVLSGLAARAARGAGKYIGVAPDCYVDSHDAAIGNTGAAQQAITLAHALDQAAPGEVIMMVTLADGVDVVFLRATDAIASHTCSSPVAAQVESGNDGLDYAKFLTWRGMLTREPPRRPDPDRPGAPPAFRSENWKFGFYASECECGARHLPPARVCVKCQKVDAMTPVRVADAKGTIASYTIDRLAFSESPPMVVAVVDFDGGGRFPTEMTDVNPDDVSIGDRVEMTFRRINTADGIHNYFWKARAATA